MGKIHKLSRYTYAINKVYFNIDDADDSSLVKHLFYLPFVKKVELKEGFIHIEKFDILEWDEVIDEVADEIKKLALWANIAPRTTSPIA